MIAEGGSAGHKLIRSRVDLIRTQVEPRNQWYVHALIFTWILFDDDNSHEGDGYSTNKATKTARTFIHLYMT